MGFRVAGGIGAIRAGARDGHGGAEGALARVRAGLPVIEERLGLVDNAAEAEIVSGRRVAAAPRHPSGRLGVGVHSEGDDQRLGAR